ncbi:MAG: PilZ domain-containing protein [Bdellovibrio sp.]|nr:PilZ domain-containing protein [Bdellovibrio sp.]
MENKIDGSIRFLAVQLAATVLIAVPVLDVSSAHGVAGALFDLPSYLLVFATGLCLFIRHKTVWLLGGSLCSMFLGLNIYQLLFESSNLSATMYTYRLFDCILVASLVAAVFHFFKYPYLDRRQHWLSPTASRYDVKIPVTMNGVATETLDLSYTGARIAVNQGQSFKLNQRVSIQLSEIDDILCQAKVVQVDPNDICVHFEGTSDHEKELIRQWLLSQK